MILIYLNFFSDSSNVKKYFFLDFSSCFLRVIHGSRGKIPQNNERRFKVVKDSWLKRLEMTKSYAYPNQVVELSKPFVEQFIWVVGTVWHFAVRLWCLEED